MFSMNAENVFAKKFLQLGVSGYVSKDAPESEISNAVKTILENKKYISPLLTANYVKEFLDKKSANPFDNLSARELEIVQHMLHGESSAQIGRSLNLQSSTVGTHKARIFEKLNCKNIIELNTLAKLNNVIQERVQFRR